MMRRRPARERLCRLLVPAAVALAVLGAAAPAAASPDETDPLPRQLFHAIKDAADDQGSTGVPAEADDLDDRPSLSLLPHDDGVIGAADVLRATAEIDNAGSDELVAGSLTLELGDAALADEAAADGWLESGAVEGGLSSVHAETVDAVGAGAQLAVEVDAGSLPDRDPGVYPLRATYTAGTAILQARSVLVVAGDRAAIGVVVPVTAPARTTGLLTADELVEITAPTGWLGQILDAVSGTEAVLAIDPAIPAAIRVLGSSAPLPAVDWLERLESLPNERFALQFGDADVAPQLQSGLDAPLQPTSLRAYESAESFVAEPIPDATPEPVEEAATEPVYPELDELLSVGEETATVSWPAEGTAGPDVIDALAADGAVSLVPSSATEQGADGAHVSARVEGALVYDADLSAALDAAALDAETHEQQLVEASAALWFAARDADGPLLVALDRVVDEEAARTAGSLRDAIDRITGSDAVDPQTLEALIAAEPSANAVAAAEADPERVAVVSTFTGADSALADVATALETPELLTGQSRAEALQLLSVAWTADPEGWREAAAAFAETTASRANGIQLTVSDQVQLLSAEAPLPVWVHNDLAWPVTVVLDVQRSNVRLDVQERVEVVVPAGSSPRVEIPVEARVGSGEVQLTVTMHTIGGVQIGEPQAMDVTVRAEWERYGIGALVGLVAVLIVGGIIRTVLRQRRRKKASAE